MGRKQPGVLHAEERSNKIKTKKNHCIYPIGGYCGPLRWMLHRCGGMRWQNAVI